MEHATDSSAVRATDYLDAERKATTKSDFYYGQVYALAGASLNHNRIVASLTIALGVRLRGRDCEPLGPDQRVSTSPEGLYSYPDLTIMCGEPQFVDDHRDTVSNPTVIFEVLSPSTQAFDRIQKARAYWTIPGLRAYVLVSQDEPRVEVIERASDTTWLTTVSTGLDAVANLACLAADVPLSEIYDRVDFADSSA